MVDHSILLVLVLPTLVLCEISEAQGSLASIYVSCEVVLWGEGRRHDQQGRMCILQWIPPIPLWPFFSQGRGKRVFREQHGPTQAVGEIILLCNTRVSSCAPSGDPSKSQGRQRRARRRGLPGKKGFFLQVAPWYQAVPHQPPSILTGWKIRLGSRFALIFTLICIMCVSLLKSSQ